MDTIPFAAAPLENRWDEARAATLPPERLLLYRSNLLGADRRVTNYGGGNTSSKLDGVDPLTGETVSVLWVKGSGGDIGTMRLDGFATLYQEKLLALRSLYRGPAHEDEMVGLYPHLAFGLNGRAASIDTPLHGFVPYPHVDHVHPDAIVAIAASRDGERLTGEIFGGAVGWIPWRRPGFELGLELARFVAEHPDAIGVVLGAHGLFTWGDTQRGCYENTIATINRAEAAISRVAAGRPAFGGRRVASLDTSARRAVASAIMPPLRGMLAVRAADGTVTTPVGHFDDDDAVLDFVGSASLDELAPLGTSCPDHFLRTKIAPLVVPFDPARDASSDLLARLPALLEDYRARYAGYYERCRRPDSPPMRDPNAVVYLVPGVGMITFAADKTTARIAAEFYANAINVMRGASALSVYQGLPEQEAFDIEYWSLEEAKLRRLPPRRALAGKVALITGGAGGIGSATARRLLEGGAAVVLCDIDAGALRSAEAALRERHGADGALAIRADVTDESSVASLYAEAALAYGGIDICVSNAGIASAAPIEDTSLALWNRNMSILATGYFLVTRDAFRLMKSQNSGGALVLVASKNAMVASAGAAAYGVAKSAEVHLSRALALEGAPHGIRSNVVNPDAVLRGSRIWEGEWGDQRARSNQTTRDDLERVYRERSLLKRSVYPEDVAEAVAFLATEQRSGKSTGNIVNVDAGHAPAFTR